MKSYFFWLLSACSLQFADTAFVETQHVKLAHVVSVLAFLMMGSLLMEFFSLWRHEARRARIAAEYEAEKKVAADEYAGRK